MSKIESTLQSLIDSSKIPRIGAFEVTNGLIEIYIKEYSKLSQVNKGLRNSERSLARKLAGLNLLKLNFSRGVKYSQLKAGIVYLIENPAFPEHYKIGMTIDLDKRLDQYQTYDPYRQFKVARYEFVTDRRAKEKELLTHPNIFNEQGEWVKKDNASSIFSSIVVGS